MMLTIRFVLTIVTIVPQKSWRTRTKTIVLSALSFIPTLTLEGATLPIKSSRTRLGTVQPRKARDTITFSRDMMTLATILTLTFKGTIWSEGACRTRVFTC